MAGWRDGASEQAQDDLDGLLDLVLPFAQQCIDERGELAPVGASVDAAGERKLAAVEWTANGVDMLSDLVRVFRSRQAELRAVALVADVTTTDGDAVRVELEHREGPAIVVLLPYRKRRFGRAVEYGDFIGMPGTAQVWSTSE